MLVALGIVVGLAVVALGFTLKGSAPRKGQTRAVIALLLASYGLIFADEIWPRSWLPRIFGGILVIALWYLIVQRVTARRKETNLKHDDPGANA